MKRMLSLLLAAAALLCACAAPLPKQTPEPPAPEPAISRPEPVPDPEAVLPAVYTPPEGLSMEETVRAYFEQVYRSYASLTDIDLSALLDTSQFYMHNSELWNKILGQRRRLLDEHNLCYVETERFPYEITFLSGDALSDDRVSFWQERNTFEEGEVLLHFTITGEPGRAYPPQFAAGAEHTMCMVEQDGRWKIVFHYYPGAIRKFLMRRDLELPSDEEALALLEEEFASLADTRAPTAPSGAALYDGEAAARYALDYTETPNPDFYHIGDWMGNCANFTSQCVWSGFGEVMTGDWYAGEGGGSPAWESVGYFWRYATSGGAMGTQLVEGISAALPGDVIQTSAGELHFGDEGGEQEDDEPDEEGRRFNHSLLLVDAQTLLLAQHSPGCFVYYSDVVSPVTRIVRPVYLAGRGA